MTTPPPHLLTAAALWEIAQQIFARIGATTSGQEGEILLIQAATHAMAAAAVEQSLHERKAQLVMAAACWDVLRQSTLKIDCLEHAVRLPVVSPGGLDEDCRLELEKERRKVAGRASTIPPPDGDTDSDGDLDPRPTSPPDHSIN